MLTQADPSLNDIFIVFMAELSTINLALYAQTDVGMVRSGNEDNFLILDLSSGKSWTASEEEPLELLTYSQGYYGTLMAVSDGMGGALAGEVASRMAVETVRDRMLQLQAHETYGQMPFYERLRLSIEEANLLINGESQTNPAHKGLGATFTAVASHGNQIYFAQVGDSRAYLIRKGKISRITKDQSLVQQLIDAGQITEEEAETHSYRNVILQALGAHNNVNVEVNCLNLCQFDTLVLCSDGLSGKMHQEEIARIVSEAADFKTGCKSLIDLANSRGGEDNITVVIAQFSGSGLPQPINDPVEPQGLARSPDTPTEINWGLGAKTDPLSAAGSPTPPDDGHTKATEPLPTPPNQSMPFTAKLPRTPSGQARTNDLSDRRGPITSVFAPEDFGDEAEMAVSPKSSKATTPLEQRQTKPLGDSSDHEMKNSGSQAQPAAERATVANRQAQTSRKGSRTNLYILSGLLLLVAVGSVVGLTSYFRRQAQERSLQEQAEIKLQQEYQSQKEGQISRLREKIAEVSKKINLQTDGKPGLKLRRNSWHEHLDKLGLRLDEIAKIPPDHLQQISQACEEVGQELKKIEDEVNSLQGLLPLQSSTHQPIKV